jgi:hypothetical protein
VFDQYFTGRKPDREAHAPSYIIFHPLGFVFHIQAILGLPITEVLIEI